VPIASSSAIDKRDKKIEELYERQIEQLEDRAEHLTKELRIAHANLSAEKKANQRRENKDDRNRNELLGIIVGLKKLLPEANVDASATNAPPTFEHQRSEKPKQSQKPSDFIDTKTRNEADDTQRKPDEDSKDAGGKDGLPKKRNHAKSDNDKAGRTEESDAIPTPIEQLEPNPVAEAKGDPTVATPNKRGFFSGFFRG